MSTASIIIYYLIILLPVTKYHVLSFISFQDECMFLIVVYIYYFT